MKKVFLSLWAVVMFCVSVSSVCASAEEHQPVRVENITVDPEAVASREWLPEYEQLVEIALDMRNNYSYAPYSHYHVGAALLGEDGTVYTGCNVENASYPIGVCAERTAIVKAVSEGCRQFQALVIVGAASDKKGSDFCAPCGMCRQAIREFCNPDFPIILVEVDESGVVQAYKIYMLEELLVDSFGPDNLS